MIIRKNSLIAILAAFVLVTVLAACGTEDPDGANEAGEEGGSEGEIRIGAALPDFDDKWLSYLQDGIRSYEAEHDDVSVNFVDAQNDADKQLNQIETFITQQVDAILVVPVDTDSAPILLSTANAADVPIVVVNRYFEGVGDATAFVGSDSIESGILQMEEVAEQLGGEGNIAIMNGILGHDAQIKRTEGNKEIIDKHDGMEVVLESDADFDRTKGLELMENWLQSGNEINAVVANNDEMAIGAIMALEAVGQLDDVLVAGIDATPDALEYVESGQLSVTVFQDATGQGRGGLETAVKAARGEEVEQEVMIPYELVTEENVEEYIKKWEE